MTAYGIALAALFMSVAAYNITDRVLDYRMEVLTMECPT